MSLWQARAPQSMKILSLGMKVVGKSGNRPFLPLPVKVKRIERVDWLVNMRSCRCRPKPRKII